MNKRTIYAICLLAFFIGAFFQYNRMDGFLRLSTIQNKTVFFDDEVIENKEISGAEADRYIVIYDPRDVGSFLTRHIIESMLRDQKKEYKTYTVQQEAEVDPKLRGVLVCAGNFQFSPACDSVLEYVKNGGSLVLLQHPVKFEPTNEYLRNIGIAEAGELTSPFGIQVNTDFLLGAQGFRMEASGGYNTESALSVKLGAESVTHVEAADGTPLVWETPLGNGTVYVYNGTARDDKSNMGLYAALISHCGEEGIYPVLAGKMFFIDDFPAPVPEGNFKKIYDELHMTTSEFFRNVWWPYMLELGEEYDVKYTGLIIETYGSQVEGPFEPLSGRAARDNVIVYGRELIAAGGELGLHGYNHQSLAPAGYNQDRLDYVPWKSQADMTEAMKELHRYVRSLYPDYDFRVYVPPSNILSPEGKAAVKEAFPGLRVYASLWSGQAVDRCYYQDFKKNADGTFELPRIAAGYIPTPDQKWDIISGINYIGVFSHFVHPDEIYYEESKDLTWAEMRKGLRELMSSVNTVYPWLEAVTASECAERMDDYAGLQYEVLREHGKTVIYSHNFRGRPAYILRSRRQVEYTENCVAYPIQKDVYLVKVEQPKAAVYWKEEM